MDKNSKFTPFEKDGIYYEIKIKGKLAGHWSDRLGGLKITNDEKGYAYLCGLVQDQSALHGILAQIRNLGLELISVIPRADEEQATEEKESKNDASRG